MDFIILFQSNYQDLLKKMLLNIRKIIEAHPILIRALDVGRPKKKILIFAFGMFIYTIR